jgi:hypothetical protein
MPIQEIHLIHHTPADFGFTDLPPTAFESLPRYVGDALRIPAKTAAFNMEAPGLTLLEIGPDSPTHVAMPLKGNRNS